MLAIKSGEQNKKGAFAILANSFLLLLIMASLLTVLAYFFKDFLLIKFGATEMIFPYAEAYMRVYLVGTVFAVLSLGLNPFLICQGFAGLAMTSVVIGALFNLILGPDFYFWLSHGCHRRSACNSALTGCVLPVYIICAAAPVRFRLRLHFTAARQTPACASFCWELHRF